MRPRHPLKPTLGAAQGTQVIIPFNLGFHPKQIWFSWVNHAIITVFVKQTLVANPPRSTLRILTGTLALAAVSNQTPLEWMRRNPDSQLKLKSIVLSDTRFARYVNSNCIIEKSERR